MAVDAKKGQKARLRVQAQEAKVKARKVASREEKESESEESAEHDSNSSQKLVIPVSSGEEESHESQQLTTPAPSGALKDAMEKLAAGRKKKKTFQMKVDLKGATVETEQTNLVNVFAAVLPSTTSSSGTTEPVHAVGPMQE